MHPVHLGFLATEFTRDRTREAAEDRLAVIARQSDHHRRRPIPPVGPLRRSAARAATALSRGAADMAHRLDRHTSDALAECPECLPGSSAAA